MLRITALPGVKLTFLRRNTMNDSITQTMQELSVAEVVQVAGGGLKPPPNRTRLLASRLPDEASSTAMNSVESV